VTAEELGGAIAHSTKSGVADLAFENDVEAIVMLRRFFNYLPLNNKEKPPVRLGGDHRDRLDMSLDTLVPDNPNKAYDIKELIHKVVDDGDFFELQPDNAKNIVTGFARMEGASIGIVANNPMVLAGCLDIKSSIKAARFVRFCDAFNIPVVTFVDVPGFMPGTAQEYGGIIKHGAKLLYAYASARCEDHGHHAQGLRRRVRRHELQAPARRRELRVAQRRDRGDGRQGRGGDHLPRGQERPGQAGGARGGIQERFANPFVAGARGYIDDVIQPHETRRRICRSLAMLKDKKLENPWRKHGNIPL